MSIKSGPSTGATTTADPSAAMKDSALKVRFPNAVEVKDILDDFSRHEMTCAITYNHAQSSEVVKIQAKFIKFKYHIISFEIHSCSFTTHIRSAWHGSPNREKCIRSRVAETPVQPLPYRQFSWIRCSKVFLDLQNTAIFQEKNQQNLHCIHLFEIGEIQTFSMIPSDSIRFHRFKVVHYVKEGILRAQVGCIYRSIYTERSVWFRRATIVTAPAGLARPLHLRFSNMRIFCRKNNCDRIALRLDWMK